MGVNFPRVEAVIIDFYHPTEYLGELARALYPATNRPARTGYRRWCHRLKHQGGRSVLDALRGWPPAGRDPAGNVHGAVNLYFENHVHRMDYPRYLSNGWASARARSNRRARR